MSRVTFPALLLLLAALCGGWLRAQEEAPAPQGQVGMDIVDLYDEAVAHLQTVCDDYQRIKSIQLARQRDIPFAEAFENVSSVMPVLREVDKDLLRKAIRDPKDIQVHKAEVEVVKKEIEMMIDLVAKLLKEIETIKAELMQANPVRDLKLEEIVRQPDFDPNAAPPPKAAERVDENADLAEVAKEDEANPAKDLTPIMHRLLDIKDLTKETPDGPVPADLFKSTDDTGVLAAITDPKVNKTYGRKIRDGGTPAEWLFVDTWYTIGPFDNANRRNLHRKFPPETVVDLDATYVGKGDKEIHWQWVQAHAPMVTPADPAEYAIYYAYTEVWCDRPMDLWVAVGSDDKANVWLNGLPIWISGDQLKGWQVNEGFRKVTFLPGRNRFLYRVENGWLNLGFSLGIRVAP